MNVEQVLDALDVQFKRPGESPHVSPGWIGTVCCYCDTGQGNYGLGINTSSLAVTCFKCGRHRLFQTLRLLARCDARRVGEVLAALTPERPAERALGASKCVLPTGWGNLAGGHRRFLKSRGLDPKECYDRWRVRGIAFAGGRYDWTILFPAFIKGEKEAVSWTTRSVGREKRYDSAPADKEKVSLKNILYGEWLCDHAVIVTEGPMDAIAAGPGGVATCGVGVTDLQLIRIARYPLRVICLDSDSSAQARAESLCRDLAPFPGVTKNVVLSTGKDASRASPSELFQLKRLIR